MSTLNSSAIALATAGFRTVFVNALSGAANTEVLAKLAQRIPTSNATETYGWLEKISSMKEFSDEAKIEKAAAQAYMIANKKWEDSVEVDVADIERDNVGKYKSLFESMATGAIEHDGTKIAELLCNGFSRPCYDGKNFFATDHKYMSGISYSNKLVKKLSSANFRDARKLLRSQRKPNGTSMNIGRELILLVGAANESIAREILEAERNAQGATNVDRGTAKVMIWPEIDVINPNSWFLFEAGSSLKPFIVQEEVKPYLRKLDDPNSEHAIKTDNFLYQAYKRTGYGYGFPQLIVGSDGTQDA